MYIVALDSKDRGTVLDVMFRRTSEVKYHLHGIRIFLDIFEGDVYVGFEPTEENCRGYEEFYDWYKKAIKKYTLEQLAKDYPYKPLDNRIYDEKKKQWYMIDDEENMISRFTNIFTLHYLEERENKMLEGVDPQFREELESRAKSNLCKICFNKYWLDHITHMGDLAEGCMNQSVNDPTSEYYQYNLDLYTKAVMQAAESKTIIKTLEHDITNKIALRNYREQQKKLKEAQTRMTYPQQPTYQTYPQPTAYRPVPPPIPQPDEYYQQQHKSQPTPVQPEVQQPTMQQDTQPTTEQNNFQPQTIDSMQQIPDHVHTAYQEYLRRREAFDGTYATYLATHQDPMFGVGSDFIPKDNNGMNLQNQIQTNNNFVNEGGHGGFVPSSNVMNTATHGTEVLKKFVEESKPIQSFGANLRDVFEKTGERKVNYVNLDADKYIETQEEHDKKLYGVNKDMEVHATSEVKNKNWHPNVAFHQNNKREVETPWYVTNHKIEFPSYSNNAAYNSAPSTAYQNPYRCFYAFPQVFGDAYGVMQQKNDMDLYRATQINQQVKRDNPTLLEPNRVDFSDPESTTMSQNPYQNPYFRQPQSYIQYPQRNMMNPNISYGYNPNYGAPYQNGGYINNDYRFSQINHGFVPAQRNIPEGFDEYGNPITPSIGYQAYHQANTNNPYIGGGGYNPNGGGPLGGFAGSIPSYGYAYNNRIMPPTEEDYELGLAFRRREVKVTKKHVNYFEAYRVKFNSRIVTVYEDEDGEDDNDKQDKIDINGYGNTGLVDLEYMDDWTKIPLNKYSKNPCGRYLKDEDLRLEERISPLIEEIDKYNKMISYVVADSLYGDELTRDEFDIYIEYLADLLELYKQRERINPNKDYRASFRYRRTPREVDPSRGMMGYASLELDLDWAPEVTVDENGVKHYSYDRGEEPDHDVETIFYNAEMQRRNMVIKKKKFQQLLEYNADQLKRMDFNPNDWRSRIEFQNYKFNRELRDEYLFYKEALRDYMTPKQFNIWWYGEEQAPNVPPDRKTIRKRQIREMTENNLRILNTAKVIDHEAIVRRNQEMLRKRLRELDKGWMNGVKTLREFFLKLPYLEVLMYWNLEEQKQRDAYKRNFIQKFDYYRALHKFNNEGFNGYSNPMPNSYSEPLDPKYGLPAHYRNYLCGKDYEEKKARFLNYCRTSKGKNMQLKPIYQ